MLFKRLIFVFVFSAIIAPCIYSEEPKDASVQDQASGVTSNAPTAESDQQISDFSLAGYGEKGKKTWDLSGKSADIFTEVVRLNDVVGNMYGKDEDVKLTADNGDFNKTDGRVHLEKHVVITTSSGMKLVTDSLDWDRKGQVVSTADKVNIQRDNITVTASGAKGVPSLKQVSLEKDVKLDIEPQAEDKEKKNALNEKTIITCDGPLEIDYEKNVAYFNSNVRVERSDSVIYSDKMDVFFIAGTKKQGPQATQDESKKEGFMANKIDRIVSRGNVRVVQGENTSYSDEAIYTAADKKLVLRGGAKLVVNSVEGLTHASAGN